MRELLPQAEKIAALLKARKETISVAESSTGGLISAALLATDGWLGLRGWQWMFILEAAPAVVFGLACLAVLSDRPADAHWLEADERRWLLAKLQAQAGQQRPVGQLSLGQVLWNKHVLVFQRAYWNFNYWQYASTEGLATDRGANTNLHATFNNQWSIHFGGTIAGLGDVFCNTCSRGGPL